MRVIAVVPAAGRANRMGLERNKVLIDVAGEPVISWVIRAICASESVSELIICTRKGEEKDIWHAASPHKGKMNISLVEGGAERQESVYNALVEVEGKADYIIVHDAARPLVTPQLLRGVLKAAIEYGAATAAVPCTDTIKEANEDGFVKRTLPRQDLYLVQTPQAFRYEILRLAHEHARKLNLRCTDDATLVEAVGERVKLVPGEPHNIKITLHGDLLLAESLLKAFVAAGIAPKCSCKSAHLNLSGI
ncbi:MAG: 2-C-methyl-D-erythritol 4-phosphate cytidylyltransferase [Armatimonadota bacterium]|nr:2-C-methyl-D-erythritol 4-phosphate cytidylyltransferase [Armatimonadota bacterium]MCX7778204.1 2-C-methyl-D-erythritol 4-phosphate cytidylyltransferase [Armatimonadota bacterium]MDW8025682.1 2-C-methyl-D-erythritol 4-phosphate cytidylyltransferase [Armatimonadota bacterium]